MTVIMAASKNLTPNQRATRSRQASHKSWANTEDRTERTAPGRRGMLKKFEDQVDPDRTLPPAERAKRVESARKAYYTRLSMMAVKVRRQRGGDDARRELSTPYNHDAEPAHVDDDGVPPP